MTTLVRNNSLFFHSSLQLVQEPSIRALCVSTSIPYSETSFLNEVSRSINESIYVRNTTIYYINLMDIFHASLSEWYLSISRSRSSLSEHLNVHYSNGPHQNARYWILMHMTWSLKFEVRTGSFGSRGVGISESFPEFDRIYWMLLGVAWLSALVFI